MGVNMILHKRTARAIRTSRVIRRRGARGLRAKEIALPWRDDWGRTEYPDEGRGSSLETRSRNLTRTDDMAVEHGICAISSPKKINVVAIFRISS
jgi:hypothetical protein